MPFWKRAEKYADNVIAGKIPACKHVKNSCKRFKKDIKRKDLILHDDGNRWCKFLELLPHTKGQWASRSERLTLSDWQIFCVVNIYGFKWKSSGRRRFREAYIEVPRKNGKSLFVAGLGIGHLTIDNEFGAEIYCGATTEKQAWEVFKPAHEICKRTPSLREQFGIEVNAKTLNVLANGSKFEPVIGSPGDGASPSCAIVDEFHEHVKSDLVDTFVTGMGAREQPLLIQITTAGADTGGPCYAKRDDVIKIISGNVDDDSIFGIVYTLDEDDKWDSVEAQRKANPNYGVSVDADFLKGQLEQAKRSAVKQSSYKTKHLNLWVGAQAAWMNMLAYQAQRKNNLKLDDFKGRSCFIAVDLASKIDIAAIAILFPPENGGKWAAFCKYYLPEDVINEGNNSRYKAWHAEGWITATPGNITDFSYIEEDLKDLRSMFEIKEVPYDPFQATQFSIRMNEEGFPMVEYGSTVRNFSEPMKELEKMIIGRQIEFNMDPVLMWMFGNVVATLNKKDNIFPNKERPENKIDGVVSIIMALGRAILNQSESDGYITGNIITL
jgi:phage terminase large subunit-like protein